MTLLTDLQREKLLFNGSDGQRERDHFPVVKLFTPDAGGAWLLTEIDPSEPTIAFGLCDLGLGFPELGYVCLEELAVLRGPFDLPVERDLHFEAKYPISVYARAADLAEGITDDAHDLAIARDIEDEVISRAKPAGPQPG